MNPHNLTSIGRPIDPEYPTNRAIALMTLIVAVGGAVWQGVFGRAWLASALWGVRAGLAVFLAWALCRELDPDHPTAAFPAAGLALLAVFLWDLPQLGVIFWMLILVRVVNRSTGLPAGVLDSLGLLGLAGWLSLQGNWSYGVVTALAFLLDGLLPSRLRRQLLFALLAVIATPVAAILGDPSPGDAPSLTGGLMALTLSLVFLPVILDARTCESVGDETGDRLRPVRVQVAQALALVSGVGVALLGGPSALAELSPLWAAVLGASATWLFNVVTP
jgi:hypothetical protein